MQDVVIVGGKNASLGEMLSNLTSLGIHVPDGFATTAEAYLTFLSFQGLDDEINATLDYQILPGEIKQTIDKASSGYSDPVEFFVEKLVEGVSFLGAVFAPNPVIIRLSDFAKWLMQQGIYSLSLNPDTVVETWLSLNDS